MQVEAEDVPSFSFNTISGSRFALWIQHYAEVISPNTVAAVRIGLQGVAGDSLPVQFLTSLGGSGTLRGLPADRYLDRVAAVFNAELRFPIIWRFGGVAGFDAGRVAGSLGKLDLRWTDNAVVGLRLVMETFVVRADVGFGGETTGFYLNFGQLF
jgi:hemolysin activation/secretion protein